MSTTTDHKVLSSVIEKGYSSYVKGKDYAFQSKVLASTVKPSLELLETGASKVKSYSPIEVNDVVASLDNKVDQCIKFGEASKESLKANIEAAKERPSKIKQGTLSLLHTSLARLNKETIKDDPTKQLEINDVIQDAREIIYQQYEAVSNVSVVKTVSSGVTTGMDKVLGVSERVVDTILPVPEEEKKDEVEESGDSRVHRAYNISKVAGKRIQKKSLNTFTALRMRTEAVIHVDLVQYSKMLDRENMKGAVSPYVEYCKVTLDNRVVEPTKKAKDLVKKRVTDVKTVAKMYKDAATNRVLESGGNFKAKVVRVGGNLVPARLTGYVVSVRDYAGKTYVDYVVAPRDRVVDSFRKVVKEQEEQQGKKDTDALTVKAGVTAVVLTVRALAVQEYDLRIAPVVAKFRGKTPVPTES